MAHLYSTLFLVPNTPSGNLELLFIEINVSSANNILIGVIYRPRNGNYGEFNNALEHMDKINN